MPNTIAIGREAEAFAARFLQKKGLKILKRNFRCKLGEIDLIAKSGDILVFAEVRLRNNRHYASGFESVDYFKQQKLIKTAQFYLLTHHRRTPPSCRFDVLSLTRHNTLFTVDWLQNAFYVGE